MSSRGGRAGECPVAMPVGRVNYVDPPAEMPGLIEEQPICRVRLLNGESGWLTTSYELGRAVLADRRFSAGRIWGRQPVGELERWLAEGVAEEGNVPHLNEADPLFHTRRRRAIMSRLSFNRVQDTRDRVQAIVDEGLDALEAAGPPADFVELFAVTVPGSVLSDLLGVPRDDRAFFVDLTDRVRNKDLPADDVAVALREWDDYVERLVADKAQNLGEDLISDMIRDESTTHQEVIKDVVGILQAGHETTTSQFGYGLFTLLRDRRRWESLKADPSTIDAVVEELLRYNTIIEPNPTERTALEDVEIGGVMIFAGETVIVSLLGANRDPSRFDAPEEFRADRNDRGHLAFGGGIHLCAGQHVARLELTLGFTALVRRFPNLRLAGDIDQISWTPANSQTAGPLTLPVTW